MSVKPLRLVQSVMLDGLFEVSCEDGTITMPVYGAGGIKGASSPFRLERVIAARDAYASEFRGGFYLSPLSHQPDPECFLNLKSAW